MTQEVDCDSEKVEGRGRKKPTGFDPIATVITESKTAVRKVT